MPAAASEPALTEHLHTVSCRTFAGKSGYQGLKLELKLLLLLLHCAAS
jgi:hypothetical protein